MYYYSRKKKLLRMILGMLLLLGIIRFGMALSNNRMLLTMNFCNDFTEVMQGAQETPELDISDALRFNGCTVPYASVTNTFYISQDTSENFGGGYFSTSPNCSVWFKIDEMWLQKSQAIASNHVFSILIQKDNQYRQANLVVSGLPVLALTETYGWENPQEMTLLAAKEEDCYEGTCTFRMRGQSSAIYPKYGFKLNLCDENYDPVKASLLGLRRDNDWILNPLYSDSTKIREKMAYQIWDEMQEFNQTKNASSNITYVEVILNHTYWGIYGLQEPIDKKQLSMNETDILYKKTDNTYPTTAELAAAVDGQEFVAGFSIKYPKAEHIEAADWEPLKRYVEEFYYDIEAPPEETADFETLTELLDFDNALDYKIFIAVVVGEDNIYKNIDYCLRYENGKYKMYMVPWDLNVTFGDIMNFDVGADAQFNSGVITTNTNSREYITLYRADNERVEQALREKWQAYRKDFLSDGHLKEMAENAMKELSDSGAMLRDNERWPECNNSTDLTEIYEFIDGHMAYLDECFEKEEWWREDHYLRGVEQCTE